MHYLYVFIMLIWFVGCGEPDLPKDQYNLEECREELLNAEDYSPGDSIDKIIVIKKEPP